MKIAVIVPVTDTSVHGYANVFEECRQSWEAFADIVVYARTVFDDGIYDGKKINTSLDRARAEAEAKGAGVLLFMSSNWYVPEWSRAKLRERCEDTEAWNYVYRGNQLGDKLFSASKMLPQIVKAGASCKYLFAPDGLLLRPDCLIDPKSGYFPDADAEMIVDVPLEITRADLEGKTNFRRNYSDFGNRPEVFDWDYWRNITIGKAYHWRKSAYQLDATGKAIAAKSKPEYLSHYLLSEPLW